MQSLILEIPGRVTTRAVEELLERQFALTLNDSETITRSYLDTFDWRILEAGGVLEAASGSHGIGLTWRTFGHGEVYGRFPLQRIPRFIWDLQNSVIRARLEQIVEVRALLPVAVVVSRVRTFSMRDEQGKIILNLELQTDDYPDLDGHTREGVFRRRIHLFPLKGYENCTEQILAALAEQIDPVPRNADPLATILEYRGIEPTYAVKKPVVSDPDLRADIAVKCILAQLLAQMEANEQGLRDDIDSEFLHDFRVAVRRTRSLLGQIKGVLPEARVARFSRDFSWLGTVTGPTRDMDVYLLMFDGYQSSLPEDMRQDLLPLYEFLRRHKHLEHGKLVRVLDSARYLRLKQDWRKFLEQAPPLRPSLENAGKPVIQIASARIVYLLQKALKQGGRISAQSPPTALHDLRKTLKKLRYLMEFFQKLYPGKKVRRLIDKLKVLQDNLGQYQDLEVQQASLGRFMTEMEQETGIDETTRIDMELLVEILARRNRSLRAAFDRYYRDFADPANIRLYRKAITRHRESPPARGR